MQGGNAMKPTKLYEKLKFICKHLVHGRQEDAHEFLRLVSFLLMCCPSFVCMFVCYVHSFSYSFIR